MATYNKEKLIFKLKLLGFISKYPDSSPSRFFLIYLLPKYNITVSLKESEILIYLTNIKMDVSLNMEHYTINTAIQEITKFTDKVKDKYYD